MSEKNRNIDELFRQELGNTTEAPPSSVWEALEQKLDQKARSDRNGRNRILLIALVLVSALIAIYFILHRRAQTNPDNTKAATEISFIPSQQPLANADLPPVNEADTPVIDQNRQENAAKTISKATTVHTPSAAGENGISNPGVAAPSGSAQNKQEMPGTGSDPAVHNDNAEAPSGLNQSSESRQQRATTGAGRPGKPAGNKSKLSPKAARTFLEHTTISRASSVAAAPKLSSGTQANAAAKKSSRKMAEKSGIEAPGKTVQAAGTKAQTVAGKTTPLQHDNPALASTHKPDTRANAAAKRTVEKAGTEPGKTVRATGTKAETVAGKTTPLQHDNTALASTHKPDTRANTAAKRTVEKAGTEAPGKTAQATGTKAETVAGKTTPLQHDNPAPAATHKPDTRANTAAKRTVEKAGTEASGKTVQAAGTKTETVAGKTTPLQHDSPAPASTHKPDTRANAAAKKTVEKTKTGGRMEQLPDSGTKRKAIAGKTAPLQHNAPVPAAANGKQNAQKTAQAINADSAKIAAISKELLTNTANGAKTLRAGKRNSDSVAEQNKLLKQAGHTVKTGTAIAASGAAMPNATGKAGTEPKIVPQSSKQRAKSAREQEMGKPEAEPKAEPESDNAPAADEDNAGQVAGGGKSSPAAVKDKSKRSLNMSIGVKAAYERGFQSYTANTLIGSIFGEVNFSKRISFVIQPGIRLAGTSSEYRTAAGSYIRAGDVRSTMYYEELDSMSFPTGFKNYAYSQTYDSIVASRLAQKKFTEFELPFMVRYKMDKNLSLLAGMSFTFGKTLKMEGVLQTYSGLSLTDSIFHHYDTAGIAPPAPGKFSHPGSTPFSAYKDPAATELINLIRFGYTIGLSYTVKQRLIVDLTLQQNLSRLSDINDQQIKKLFTQPYVRLSVGYSIFGRRK